jgi:Tfp pilus assembly protein PilF
MPDDTTLAPTQQTLEVEDIRDEICDLNNDGSHALAAKRPQEALRCFAQAAALLLPSEDHLAPVIYENMGLALMELGDWRGAQRALLRALDGDAMGRQLSARLLIVALFRDGKPQWAQDLLGRYQARWGSHPDIP